MYNECHCVTTCEVYFMADLKVCLVGMWLLEKLL